MRELMEKCIALRALVLPALPPPLHAAAQADISKWLAAGKRIHNIAAQFPLSETAQAHLAVEKGDKLGTVIVDCARLSNERTAEVPSRNSLSRISTSPRNGRGEYHTGVVRSSLQLRPNASSPSAR